MLEGRKHPRTSEKLLVEISTMEEPFVRELASAENVSPDGVRVATQRSWPPGSRVLVKSSGGDLWARARVVYCKAIGPKSFALGLEFLDRTGEWIMRDTSWQFWDKKK